MRENRKKNWLGTKTSTNNSGSARLKLRIVGLDCVTCSRVIQNALYNVKGIRYVGVSYMLDLVLVDFDPSVLSKEEIVSLVKRTGYDVVPVAT